MVNDMERLYLDNAATSFPKAPGVAAAVHSYMTDIGVNVGRGSYQSAYGAELSVLEARESLARLFHFQHAQNVIFTLNVTYAINMLIKGLLRNGDHCLVSSLEHNAVMRPLAQLSTRGVTFDRIPCDDKGMDLGKLRPLLRPNTRALVVTHASNVSGTILPVEALGEFCREHGLFFILDAAQTAGVLDIDFNALGLSALAFTGHKGLLGPQGVGGFLASNGLIRELEPLLSGGTGSMSDSEEIPDQCPDRFEPGTANLPGIFGLAKALEYLEARGVLDICAHERMLTQRFINGIEDVPKLRVLGPGEAHLRTGVVSIDFEEMDNAEVTYRLDSEHGIMVRCGLHCAPSAHRSFKTFPKGTVRFSFGAFNNADDADRAVDAVRRIAGLMGRR